MSRSRRLTVGVGAVVAAAALVPTTAAAAPDGSLQGLVLTGECPKQLGLEHVRVAPWTPFLFAPLRLLDEKSFAPTGKWLFPYTIEASGEGLKARHWEPGVPYTRPGRPPKNQVTCVFNGQTEEGDVQFVIAGPVFGR